MTGADTKTTVQSLGVIDAETSDWLQNVPDVRGKNPAAFAETNHIFTIVQINAAIVAAPATDDSTCSKFGSGSSRPRGRKTPPGAYGGRERLAPVSRSRLWIGLGCLDPPTEETADFGDHDAGVTVLAVIEPMPVMLANRQLDCYGFRKHDPVR